MLYAINGWTFAPRANWPAGAFPMRREVFEAIELHRRTLGLTAEKPRITKQWVKAETSQPAMLLYNVLLNRFYESIDAKRFNIVPICHVKRHFIAIDTWSLFGILREAGLASGSVDNFVAMRDEQWRSVFKIEQLQGQHCTVLCLPWARRCTPTSSSSPKATWSLAVTRDVSTSSSWWCRCLMASSRPSC